ncbi:hypothetical protein [Flavobacterium chungangensis]|uniref:Bacteriocin n=1 Tax=Flavobacterium chungangensis TaxID=2708132 RepID=A0ABV8ZBX2_9FLAO
MNNLDNLNFTELSSSEMKLVQGGNWIDDLLVFFGGSIEALAAYLGMTVEEVRKLLGT